MAKHESEAPMGEKSSEKPSIKGGENTGEKAKASLPGGPMPLSF